MGPQRLRGSDSQRSGSLPSLFQPLGSLTCSFLPFDAAPDEDERAGRLPEHHGALAPQRLLAAHPAAAQRRAALPPARYVGGEGRGGHTAGHILHRHRDLGKLFTVQIPGPSTPLSFSILGKWLSKPP